MEPLPDQDPRQAVSRRTFLQSAAAAIGASTLGVPGVSEAGQPSQVRQPRFARVGRSFAQHIIDGDCRMCVLGDSIATDSSSASNLSHGIQRTWRPTAWSFRFGRLQIGPPSWATGCAFDTFYYSAATGGAIATRFPGELYSGGEQSISPNIGVDWRFGGTDVPDFGPMLATVSLNDPVNYGVGNWAHEANIRGRALYWRGGAAMAPTLRLRGKRGAMVVGEAPIPMQGGPGQIAFADVDCGNSELNPSMEITSAPGVDERGRLAYWFGAGFWRSNAAGQRTPGFGLMQIGEGGWQTADHLSPFRCGDAGLRQYMAACFAPNTFLMHIGANPTVAEAQSLNAGDYRVFRDNLARIIKRYTTQAILAGAAPPIRWLMVNPFPMAHLVENWTARSRAMFELMMQDPENRAVVDLAALAAFRTGTQSWYTADGVHPTADGAAYLAGLIWSQIAAAY
jgi:hypothetical protein